MVRQYHNSSEITMFLAGSRRPAATEQMWHR